MAAGSTYTPIATTTLGSGTTTVNFTSIPSTYTDLVLVCNAFIANAFRIYNFNGDTGSNYSYTYMTGNGSAASSGRDTTAKIFVGYGGTTSTTPTVCTVNFENYANTTTYKTVVARGSSSEQWVSASVGLWRNTAAISSFTIISDSANFLTGSTFTLYGIAAA